MPRPSSRWLSPRATLPRPCWPLPPLTAAAPQGWQSSLFPGGGGGVRVRVRARARAGVALLAREQAAKRSGVEICGYTGVGFCFFLAVQQRR